MKQKQGVQSALENSCAVLAAYCRADSLTKLVPEEHMMRVHELLQNQVSGGIMARQQDWLQQRAARRQKVLVGLVRASSDRHFVGTLDSIMIHPGLRRRGLGRRCAYIHLAVPPSSISSPCPLVRASHLHATGILGETSC